MMEAAGKPLLRWQIERLQRSELLDSLVVATTGNLDDTPVAELAERMGISCYRGSEHDVLDRMYRAALGFEPKSVVRLTGDCPLIDVSICDELIRLFIQSDCDYANTSPRHAEGLDCEILSFAALETAWREAKMASEREHVTLYVRESGLFKCAQLDNVRDDSKYRITVDELADYEVVRFLFENLSDPVRDGFDAVRELLEKHPEVYSWNNNILRNEGVMVSLKNDRVFGNNE